jgi:nicotinic acetylcholine receptor
LWSCFSVSSPGKTDNMGTSQYPARVSHNGYVMWDIPLILKSSCRLNVRYFPLDEQECTLEFGSWTYDGHHLDVYNYTWPNQIKYFHGDGEWDLTGFDIAYHEEYYPEFYPSVRYTLRLKRKPLYYHINIVVPCLSILLCGMLVFLLPPDR